MRASGTLGGEALGSAPEHPGEERHRIDLEGPRDRNELRHVDAPLEGLDPLDPVGRHLKLPGELSLGEPTVPACRCKGRGNGSMAAGILHARTL